MTWPRVPYHAYRGRTGQPPPAWPPATLVHPRPRPAEADARAVHMDHDESVVVHAPAARTPAARAQGLTAEFAVIKRARADGYRRMAEIVFELKRDDLWLNQGAPDFDTWCWHHLHIKRDLVGRLLALATEPIGGRGRAGRPRGAPARNRASEPAAPVVVSPHSGETTTSQVEEFPDPENSSTSPSTGGAVAATEAAAGRGRLGWAARQLGQIERNGVARWRAALPDAERPVMRQAFTRLSELFARCAQAIAEDEEEDADA